MAKRRRSSPALNLVPTQAEPAPAVLPTQRFLNRDMSWLQFNARVLDLARDPNVPLLERVNFLAIFSNNLDEFFMKRVGGLKRQVVAGLGTASLDGLTPRQQLMGIYREVESLLQLQAETYLRIKPELQENGIHILAWKDLTKAEKEFAAKYFNEKVFPILTPLSVDLGHPFPFISNLSTSLGFALSHPGHEDSLFARIKISGLQPELVQLPRNDGNDSYRFLPVRDLIIENAAQLFPGLQVNGCMEFRVTRTIELEVDEEDADDLRDVVEEELKQRRLGSIVRLEHGPKPNPWILNFILDELELGQSEVFELRSKLDYGKLRVLHELELPALKYSRWTPTVPQGLSEEPSLFPVIRDHDLFVHHPFHSFTQTVERFLREAAEDPKVLAIKMTVYRVGHVSPLIPYLIRAAEEDKQVVCLVELKARFDEEINIYWSGKLEKAGVHVVHGVSGLKTHAKTLLVVRQETDGIRCYAHVGTGNYHARTSTLYTDMGFFTARPEYTTELVHFFNYLTGRSLKDDYAKLLVAPVGMEKQILAMISEEIEHHRAGRPSGIIAKMNSLEDPHVMEELYRASREGVRSDLIVRGLCCLRPGVPDLSENIKVLSIVGRFLEHSRIFYFRAGQEDPLDGKFFLSSADWMTRNLHRRVELAVPVESKSGKQLCWKILQNALTDQRDAWESQSDGTYVRRTVPLGEPSLGSHDRLMEMTLRDKALGLEGMESGY